MQSFTESSEDNIIKSVHSRNSEYLVPKVSTDGESHELMILAAVGSGLIAAICILFFVILYIEKCKKKKIKNQSLAHVYNINNLEMATSGNSFGLKTTNIKLGEKCNCQSREVQSF